MLRLARPVPKPDRFGRIGCAPAIRRTAVWVGALIVASGIAISNSQDAQTAGASVEFDIPSQSLTTALNLYGDVTGREALYDASLAAGRISGGVYGTLTLDEALERLLSGTGLAARFVSESSFVLLPNPAPPRPSAPQASSPAHQRYYGLLQEHLLDALCRSADAHPGRYRIAVMMWISPTGVVEKSHRLGSVGTADVDRQIDSALHRVRLSEPPPAGFAQPVLILLVPQVPGVAPGCEKAESRLQPSRTTP